MRIFTIFGCLHRGSVFLSVLEVNHHQDGRKIHYETPLLCMQPTVATHIRMYNIARVVFMVLLNRPGSSQ